jgi:TolB-like protein
MADDSRGKRTPEFRESTERERPVMSLSGFWQELLQRHVVRVVSIYVVVSWLIIQIADSTFESFGIPPWAFRFVVIMLALGLPISVVMAWALELTPDGIRRTGSSQQLNGAIADKIEHQRRRRWFAIFFASAVPTLIFGSLALFFYLRLPGETVNEHVEQVYPGMRSIAVLPLVNMSDIASNAFFAAGVHEDILTNLSRISGLKVVSRTSAMRYLDSELGLREIGAGLGVDYIVEGSVRRVDNHVRVTVQLVDAFNDVHLWANSYDRELIDVFATQSAIAREISNSVHLAIYPESVGTLQGMPTRSVKAYDLYLKARSIGRSEPQSEAAILRQRELLEEAVRIDPDFVEPWAMLNDVYDVSIELVGRRGWFLPADADSRTVYEQFYSKSLNALRKAFSLDPENVETLIARASGAIGEEHLGSEITGNYYEGADVIADNSEIRKKIMDYTIEKYPESAMARYVLGWWYVINANDVESAKPVFKKALALDPLHARIVEGSMAFFQIVADEDMVAMLSQRLAQISPEKGSDQFLGKVDAAVKISALVNEFYRTADESILETITEVTESDEFRSLEPLPALRLLAAVWQMKNDRQKLDGVADKLLSSVEQTVVFDNEAAVQQLYLAGSLLTQYQVMGDADKSEQLARFILRLSNDVSAPPQNEAILAALQARAHAALGQKAEARELVDKLLHERSNIYNVYGIAGYYALSALDPGRAASLALEESRSFPAWFGLDIFAAFHSDYRDIIVQPAMQAHYVQEGKWVDYLAARVPEYAKYRGD